MRMVIGGLAAVVCSCVLGTALAEPVQFDGDVSAEVYKEANGESLWIYRFDPPGHDPTKQTRPAAVFFFGGGWNSGTVTQFEQQARYLASRGMIAFVADYRVKTRQGTTPRECVEDGKSAIRWVRQHAKRLGVDPQRIAAGGGSAGGHVAATTGICNGFDAEQEDASISSKANALLLFNPVYDNGPDGYGYARVKDWFPEISPLHNISDDAPPTIVFLGARDSLIPVATGVAFDTKMREAGIVSELWIYDGAPHGFFNESRNRDAFVDTVRRMDAFLVRLGWLSGSVDEASLQSVCRKPAEPEGSERIEGRLYEPQS